MTTLTIRNLDPNVKNQLRLRAARNGRSMEAEVRAIVSDAVRASPDQEVNLAEAIRRRFAPFGGVDDLQIMPRASLRDPPLFDP